MYLSRRYSTFVPVPSGPLFPSNCQYILFFVLNVCFQSFLGGSSLFFEKNAGFLFQFQILFYVDFIILLFRSSLLFLKCPLAGTLKLNVPASGHFKKSKDDLNRKIMKST